MFILALITNQSLFQLASSEGLMLGSHIAPQHDFHGYVWFHGYVLRFSSVASTDYLILGVVLSVY